ncbi:hypothetical protein [Paenibacillus oryzisoli]|uniref:Uncharacterized protein n=1 Tax=Paenibacillus oryzisoli TaxID=1850517 RepID=A0A198A476_9BACL|nr:hypothetical protein [Paenibacillus oryzisoli]OAS15841.1 hypothetical protein A8708_23310 [Paenibacillus oryzisoli]
MERVIIYTKVIDFIGLILLGIFLGFTYSIVSIVILAICSPYLETYYEMFTQIYTYFLPLAILLTTIVFKQVKPFILILVAILTGTYFMYLVSQVEFF